MLETARLLALKDLRLFFRDRSALLLTLVLPIVLATVFGSAMAGMMGGGGSSDPSSGGMKRMDLLVEDRDQSPESAQLFALLEDSSGLRPLPTREARRQVAGGESAAALVIPNGFGKTSQQGVLPSLILLRDPSQPLALQVIQGNLIPILFESATTSAGSGLIPRVMDMLGWQGASRGQAEALMDSTWSQMGALLIADSLTGGVDPQGLEADTVSDPLEGDGGFDFMQDLPAMLGLVTEDVAGGTRVGPSMPRSAGGSHAVAAVAVMMLMFSMTAAGGTLMEEDEAGTLLRLRLAPSAGSAVLLGKLLTLTAIGGMQLALLFLYGQFVFAVPVFAEPLMLMAISGGVILASSGLGLLFATACRTRKQMEGVSTLIILLMSALGGAWFPREVTPDWFQTAGLFTITAYAMDAYHGLLWYGKGLLGTEDLAGLWPQLAVLYGAGLALMLANAQLYRRRFA